MRCMTAIWPAGPPKLSAATRAHVQKASRRLTPCGGVPTGTSAVRAAVESFTSRSRLLTWPVVGFCGGIAAPAIEGVVERHRRVKLRKIVLIHARITQRRRQQTRALGNEVGPRGVSAAHDLGKVEKGLRSETKLLDHRIDRGGLAAMTPEDALDVERCGIEALCDARHFWGTDKEKDGVRIYEATDQPGTGNAVDLRPTTRYPQGVTLVVTRWNLIGADQQLAGLLPPFKSAFHDFRTDILVPQPGGGALA